MPSTTNRDEILANAFAHFDTPRQKTGLRWQPSTIEDYAPPGDEFVYPVTMQHLGELITDTYSLHIEDSLWPVSLSTTSVKLGPCSNELITITMQVPDNLSRNLDHNFAITAVSQSDPSVEISLPIHHKTPGQILLVDDDRWYNQEEIYRAALTDAGLTFDEWDIGWDNNVKGTPPQSLLNAYNYVIWFTGYDWFRPVTTQENKTLTNYLEQGGRLFMSSQDFLYYNFATPLTQQYLGIQEYQESISPTLIYRGHPSVPTNLSEPLPLTFKNFRNNGDGLIPGKNANPFVWHNEGMAAGVANTNPTDPFSEKTELYRTIFFGFPFEKLPAEARAPIMNSVVGWLSDLGDSTFAIDQRNGAHNETRQYTITLRNNPLANTNQVTMTNNLPTSLKLQTGSLTGGASYHAASHQISWHGQLGAGGVHTITYQAKPNQPLPDETRIDNKITIQYDRHEIAFDQTASFWINAPDLSQSVLSTDIQVNGNIQNITYTLALNNSGSVPTKRITPTIQLSEHLQLGLSESNNTNLQNPNAISQGLTPWSGTLSPGETAIITIPAYRRTAIDEPEWLTAVAYLDDGVTVPIIKAAYSHLPPKKHYFPTFVLIE